MKLKHNCSNTQFLGTLDKETKMEVFQHTIYMYIGKGNLNTTVPTHNLHVHWTVKPKCNCSNTQLHVPIILIEHTWWRDQFESCECEPGSEQPLWVIHSEGVSVCLHMWYTGENIL